MDGNAIGPESKSRTKVYIGERGSRIYTAMSVDEALALDLLRDRRLDMKRVFLAMRCLSVCKVPVYLFTACTV